MRRREWGILIGLGAAVMIAAGVLALLRQDGTPEPVIIVWTATPAPTDTLIPTQAISDTPSPTTTPSPSPMLTATLPPTASPSPPQPPAAATPLPTATHTPSPTLPPQVVITSEVGGFIRNGPGIAYTVIGEAVPGGAYAASGYTDGGWYQIRLPDGREGWVSSAVASLRETERMSELALISTLPTLAASPSQTTTATATPPADAPAYVAYERGNLRLRATPSETGEVLTLLDELTPLTPLARTSDSLWLQVQTPAGEQGWVMAQFLTLNIALDSLPTPESNGLERCVSVVGDSLPHGNVVYQIPGYGYVVARTTPLSVVLAESFAAQGWTFPVIDRTLPAASLSPNGVRYYPQDATFTALLSDRCAVAVIMPWLNDLSVVRDPATHISQLTGLITTLQQANPGTQILLLSFYYGRPVEFSYAYAENFYPGVVAAFNTALFAACTDGTFPAGVTCLDSESVLIPLAGGHVAGNIGQAEFEANLYAPLQGHEREILNAFWASHPNDPIIGDGVHLSLAGKRALAGLITPYVAFLNESLTPR